MKPGVHTTPTVVVFAVSGVRSGLPRETRRIPWLLPPVRRSWKPVDVTPAGWYRSFMFGARKSDEWVLRNRTESTICQLSPIFQESPASKFEYLARRPARL